MCFRVFFKTSEETNPSSDGKLLMRSTLNPWAAPPPAPRHNRQHGTARRESGRRKAVARGVGCSTLLYIKWAAQHSVSQHLCGFQHRRSSPWETLGASWSVFSDTTSDTLSVIQWITCRAHMDISVILDYKWFLFLWVVFIFLERILRKGNF